MMMENLPYVVRLMMSATFKTFKEGPFLTKPVGELMWGYDSGLVDFLNKYLPGMIPTSGKFGLFSEVSIRNASLSSLSDYYEHNRFSLGNRFVSCMKFL